MPVAASAGTTDDSQTRSVSQAPCGRTPVRRGELVVQRLHLADAVAVRNRGEHRLGVAGTEQFDLAATDHRRQQFHVGRMVLAQPVEQPAGKVRGEAEVGVGVQGFEKGLVAALVRVFDDFREIADRLVGMDAEEQGNRLVHCETFFRPGVRGGIMVQVARRIVPPLSGEPAPWLMGWSRLAGAGSCSSR